MDSVAEAYLVPDNWLNLRLRVIMMPADGPSEIRQTSQKRGIHRSTRGTLTWLARS